MKLTAAKSAKADKLDHLLCTRADGTSTSVAMPRQGILPHDLIHYVVESTLGYRHAFLGEVANGADIAFAMQMSHDLAHTAPSPELSQAEAIVESLQAQRVGDNHNRQIRRQNVWFTASVRTDITA